MSYYIDMIGERIGATIAAASLLSGCSVIEYATPQLIPHQGIDYNQLPDDLPDEVAEQIPNVAAIRSEMRTAKDLFNSVITYSICSGVRIDEHDYLSAGHCFDIESLRQSDNYPPYCQSIFVDIPRSSDGNLSLEGSRISGYVPRQIPGQPEQANMNEDDKLLIEVDTNNLYSPQTKISFNKVASGTDLYAINYEPAIDGENRNPNPEADVFGQGPASINMPAIIGGIAIRYVNQNTIEAISANKSYGQSNEDFVRQGASGGPVYNSRGELIGILTATVDEPMTVGEYEDTTGISLPNMDSADLIKPFYIKTISESDIGNLQQTQAEFEQCY